MNRPYRCRGCLRAFATKEGRAACERSHGRRA